MRVRAAGPDDAALMAAIHERAFDRPWKGWELRRVLSTTGTFAFAVDGVEQMWGFAVARMLPSEAEILTVAVDETRRRRGVGRALTRQVAAHAAAQGAERLLLEVAVDNPAGLALYRSLGFTGAGVRRNYYARPGATRVDAEVLELRLPTAPR